MKLPSQERCAQVIRDLDGDPALSQWEADFIESNRGRTQFTDKQRETIARLEDAYEV